MDGEDEMAARTELPEPRELRRRPLAEAGALARVRLLVTRLEEARQRGIDGASEEATVEQELLRLVEARKRAVGAEPAVVGPLLLELRERGHTSSTIVTGPSLTSSTSIFAPKTPVSTGTPSARSSAQKRS